MTSKVWPEMADENEPRKAHEIMCDFCDAATKEELLEKMWFIIKYADSDENGLSDILYMIEYTLGEKRRDELYDTLKKSKYPFRIVAIDEYGNRIYFGAGHKFSSDVADSEVFQTPGEAWAFYAEATAKCGTLFIHFIPYLEKFDVEQNSWDKWAEIETEAKS